MLLSVSQLNQIYTLLQEYPTATNIVVRPKNSVVGPCDFVDFYETTPTSIIMLDTVNISDQKG